MATLTIDGYIGQGAGLDSFFGEGSGFSLSMLNAFLDDLDPKETELKVEINSGGGQVTEGFALHDKLVASGLEITTEVLGMCGSIATIVACAAPRERRGGHENSDYYIHNPYWQPWGDEALEADDLKALQEDLKQSETKILDFYVKNTDADKETLKGFMDGGEKMTMKQAKKYGFIGNIIKSDSKNKVKYLIAAFVDQKKIAMAEKTFTKEQKSWFEKQFNSLSDKLKQFKAEKPEIKNEIVALEDDTEIFIDTEDGDFVGKSVFTVEEGEPTETSVEDGSYNLKDGREIVVAGGVVESITEEEIEALKKENADLKEQLEAKNKEATELKSEKETTEAKAKEIETELGEIKNMVLGKVPVPGEQKFKGADPVVPKSMYEQVIELRKQKQAKN